MKEVTGELFKEMVLCGANTLHNNYPEIDALNVFPVPDGDTGTNMSLTFSAGAKEVDNFDSNNIGDISKKLSKGLLMGARGNSGVILSQIFRASRLSFTIIAVFAIPLMVEADFVLTMWLKNPPEYAGLFCRTFLFCFLVSRLVGGFDSAICATGRIKWYQIIMSFFSILSVFVVALIICLDGGILGVCYIIITFEIINMIGSVVFCHKIVGLSVYSWLNMVLKKAIIALIISALVALIIELSITADFIWTHLLKCFLLFVSTGCICWFTLIEENERIQLLKLVGKIKRMFV